MTNDPNEASELERLKQENAQLREKLAHVTTEAEMYRLTIKEWANNDLDFEPMSEAEIHEMQTGPRGRPPLEVIEEFERNHLRGRE